MVNQDGEPTPPHKLETGTKLSVSNILVLFCPCVLQKETENVYGKALNMRNQSQKDFWDIFVGIKQHRKGYLIYVPNTQKTFYL